MSKRTGVYAVYFLYRSRYAFVTSHTMKDDEHHVNLGGLEKALIFERESDAQAFIEQDMQQEIGKMYHISELSLDEVLQYCPEIYEVRRISQDNGAA